MTTSDYVLRGGTLVDASTDGTPTDLLIRGGKIAAPHGARHPGGRLGA